MVVLTILIVIWASDHWIRCTHTQICLEGLPSELCGFRIVLLTDLHDAEFGLEQVDLLNTVARQKPDIIVFAGDLLDSKFSDVQKALNFMEKLGSIAPVYFVEGNHDFSTGKTLDCPLSQKLKAVGVIYLFNNWVCIERNGQSIILAGVGDQHSRRDRLDQALQGRPANLPCILLSHNPGIFLQAAEKDVNIVLAGHNHGGQIRLPLLPALYAPGQGVLPRYDSGLYREGNSCLYLSRGLGHTSILNFRFFNRPEVAVIVLN
ncbi:MAG TPA: metallophosphoesterase [Syntrophomonadaceae bacterium]|nr:metallophosphoesterase [Syntrophomonadaceae bacterium]